MFTYSFREKYSRRCIYAIVVSAIIITAGIAAFVSSPDTFTLVQGILCLAGALNLPIMIISFHGLFHVRYTQSAAYNMFCNRTIRKLDYDRVTYITIMGGSYLGELREKDGRQLAIMTLHSGTEIPNMDMRADSIDDHLIRIIRNDEVLKSDIVYRSDTSVLFDHTSCPIFITAKMVDIYKTELDPLLSQYAERVFVANKHEKVNWSERFIPYSNYV